MNGWRLLAAGGVLAAVGVIVVRGLVLKLTSRRPSRGVVSDAWLAQHAVDRPHEPGS